jgi:hypothetical protein
MSLVFGTTTNVATIFVGFDVESTSVRILVLIGERHQENSKSWRYTIHHNYEHKPEYNCNSCWYCNESVSSKDT